MTHFEKHFDLDSMLDRDTVWLSMQVELPIKDFLEIASKIDLRQKDWDKFWKQTQKKQNIFRCVVFGKHWELNREEFEFVKKLLGDPEVISDSENEINYVWGDYSE
jgi:hypothetical protein